VNIFHRAPLGRVCPLELIVLEGLFELCRCLRILEANEGVALVAHVLAFATSRYIHGVVQSREANRFDCRNNVLLSKLDWNVTNHCCYLGCCYLIVVFAASSLCPFVPLLLLSLPCLFAFCLRRARCRTLSLQLVARIHCKLHRARLRVLLVCHWCFAVLCSCLRPGGGYMKLESCYVLIMSSAVFLRCPYWEHRKAREACGSFSHACGTHHAGTTVTDLRMRRWEGAMVALAAIVEWKTGKHL